MSAVAISFNGTSLQTANILTSIIEHDQLPDRTLYTNPLARADGSKLTASFFNLKNIKVSGMIIGSTTADLDSRIDTLRQALTAQEAQLDIGFNSGTRRYVATLLDSKIARSTAGSTADFEFTFQCATPWGVDTGSSTFLASTVLTTASSSTAVTVGGSAYSQSPIITLVINSGTGMSGAVLAISNPATVVSISITRSWSAADTLVINTQTLAVTVNGTAVDYSGVFPTWVPGAGSIGYADGFTTRNVSLSATYTKRYM